MTRRQKRSPSRPPTGRTKKTVQCREVSEPEGPGLIDTINTVGNFFEGAVKAVDGFKKLVSKLRP